MDTFPVAEIKKILLGEVRVHSIEGWALEPSVPKARCERRDLLDLVNGGHHSGGLQELFQARPEP